MPTKRQIREGVTEDLNLSLLNQRISSISDSDTIVCATLRDQLGDVDNRVIEGAFVYFKNKNLFQAFTQAATLTSDITAAATSVAVTHAGAGATELKPGDYIDIDSEILYVTDVDQTSTTAVTLTVERGALGTTAATHSAAAAITQVLYGQWRSISSHTFSTNSLDLTRALLGTFSSTNIAVYADFYFILSPSELETIINLALSKLWFRDIQTYTLTSGDNTYSLTDSASWLTDPGQIISLDYKYTSSDGYVLKTPVTNRRINSTDDTVDVVLYDMPESVDTVVLEVTGRHWYDAIYEDSDVTTCPLPLVRAQAKMDALTKIFNKLGQAGKNNYASELGIVSEELEKMKARYRQAITPLAMTSDESFLDIEVPVTDADWSNWT